MADLLPFPRFYHLPDAVADTLPVTRDGIRSLSPFPFVANKETQFPLLEIDIQGGMPVRGICGLLPAGNFLNGLVRPHERTLGSRLERQRKLELADAGALGKPVLLTVPSLTSLYGEISTNTTPSLTYHGGKHTYRLLTGHHRSKPLPLADLGRPVIADGHHRAYTHAALAAEGHEDFSLIPVVIAGADELTIGSFLRVIEFVGDNESLIEVLSPYFHISPVATPQPVTLTSQWLLGYRGQYYHLTRRDESVTDTDPGWLNATVLPEAFGITDTRTDHRILSVDPPYRPDGTLHYPPELFELVTLLGKPITPDRFFAEVDAGRTLPPKSTRFTPRIPSGLLVWLP